MRSVPVVALLLVAALPATAAAADPSPGTSGAGPAWFLVGGADHPTLFQPLGAGRALVCTNRSCDVWDGAAGAWRPTDAVVLPRDTLAHLRRRDGDVVAIDGAGKMVSEIWSPTTGRWTEAARLPEPLSDVRVGELADGRIVASGRSSAIRRLRAYVAEAGLGAWSVLVDAPAHLTNPRLVPTPTGALLLAGDRVWRHDAGGEGWREISFSPWMLGRPPSVMGWGDEVLLVAQHDARPEARMVGPDGQLRVLATLPLARVGFGLQPISTAAGSTMWLLGDRSRTYLWRRPEEAPIALPPNQIDPAYETVVLDDEHLLGVGPSGAVVELALDGKPPGLPCDGVLRYLTRPSETPASAPVLALVSAGCREQVRRGEAPALLTLVRDWVGQPGRREIGEALECALQDDGVMKELPSWFQRENMPSTRVVCYQSLVTWPAAEGVWKGVLGTGVRTTDNRWWVDEAVNTLAATVETAEVRERLVTVVRAAAARHAQGFDTLRDRVCTPDPTMSGARRQTCAELASQQEADWRRQEASAAIEAARRENSPLRDPTRFVVASAVFAGGVAVAYATRNGDASRVIATAAGAVGGAALGFTAIFVTVVRDKWIYTSGSDFGMLLGATFAGGVLGGIAAYALTPSAWSRAPVTAAGLVVPYLLTVDGRF